MNFKSLSIEQIKERIIEAGYKSVEELIKVAEEAIVTNTEEDVSVDRLKNAAATKKLAIFDAFEILTKIENEKENLHLIKQGSQNKKEVGFAESRARK
jgi:ectoine hydroxylase-related dioxygenase (phytanoyl-CoA dioxygenase family)